MLLARIQQRVVERGRAKLPKGTGFYKSLTNVNRQEVKSAHSSTSNLWKERQLRDYRKLHGLCFHCGQKFEPGHLEECPKRTKPQVHALAINELDQSIGSRGCFI
jgi:hypothetical protein